MNIPLFFHSEVCPEKTFLWLVLLFVHGEVTLGGG